MTATEVPPAPRSGRATTVMLARLLCGGIITAWLLMASALPDAPAFFAPAAIAAVAVTLWRPDVALAALAAIAGAGALLAPPPARAAELLAWAFLAGLLLRVRQPLSSGSTPRVTMLAALTYFAAAVASWLSLTVGEAAGVAPVMLPLFLLRAIPTDYFVFFSPAPETTALLQTALGVGLFAASGAIVRRNPAAAGRLAAALAISAATLSIATLFHLVQQWAAVDYATWFPMRYVRGERESLHLTDLNAAGSLYVLAALTAAPFALRGTRRRAGWWALLALMIPGLWLAGSLSAILAAIVVAAAALGVRRYRSGWTPSPRWRVGMAVAAVLVCVMLITLLRGRGDERASAGSAMAMRTEFAITSARMLASAPVYGVGVGRYFDRSSEFMPSSLRARYGNENAHNYFAQEFAELGATGGALFIWLMAATWWTSLRRREQPSPAADGLFLGVSAYLLTCLTGHPLLVAEAAIPFWCALGVVAGTAPAAAPRRLTWVIVALGLTAAAANAGRGALAFTRATEPPAERGFHLPEVDDDGTSFHWVTRHAVTYIPSRPGFLTLTVMPPEDDDGVLGDVSGDAVSLETIVAGRVVDRRPLPRDAWTTIEIPVRDSGATPFRRVDLRANREWRQRTRIGARMAERPVAVKLAAFRWSGGR